jgi:phosphatidylethanolamine N-methyltransferase
MSASTLTDSTTTSVTQPTHVRSDSVSSATSATSSVAGRETPSATEGETAAESDAIATDTSEAEGELEAGGTETEYEDPALAAHKATSPRKSSSPPKSPKLGTHATLRKRTGRSPPAAAANSQHDLLARYFRKDAIVLHNVDLLRTSDLQLVLLVAYPLAFTSIPSTLSSSTTLYLYALHALGWLLWQTFGLGVLLKAQSESKFLVRHFLKHYHYPAGEGAGKGAVAEAFANWKQLYNLSMCMTYGECQALCAGETVCLLKLQRASWRWHGKRTRSRRTGRLEMSS